MGYQAACELRFEGKTTRGTAVLEQRELIVRGPVRLSVPLAAVTETTVQAGWLRIRFHDRIAEIGLGPAAATWAKRIANPRSRIDKLGVKPGMRVLLVGEVEPGFIDELTGAGAIVHSSIGATAGSGGDVDLVFVAVDGPASLDRLLTLRSVIVPAGAIWTLRTKGHPAVSEAATMAAGKRAGLVDVKVVSFSDTVTAEKFVIPVASRPIAARARRPAASKTATRSRAR